MKYAILLLCGILSGCAVAEKIEANEAANKSRAEYQQCLRDNPKDVKPCENLMLIYMSNVQREEMATKALNGGGGSVIKLNQAPTNCTSTQSGPFVNTSCY